MSKKNRLTFFIFLALFLGVGLGYYLNVNTFSTYNNQIVQSDNRVKELDGQLLKVTDSTSATYAGLQAEKKLAEMTRYENEKIREKKLEPLTLLSDIFLRLIKMIVAPLVFSTLVVGVAKVGDV